MEGWAEFWPCVLQREKELNKTQQSCRYPNPIPGKEAIDIEENIQIWDHDLTSYDIPISFPGVDVGSVPCYKILRDSWCEIQEYEEFAVAGLLWDLYDPKDASDNDDVDLNLQDLWSIIGKPTKGNDLSDMRDVYLAFAYRISQSDLLNEDQTRVTTTTLNQIFINHGFYADDGNHEYDGESAGWAGKVDRR